MRIGNRLIVKPFRITRPYDDYQQQHILIIYLRWPTYKLKD